MSRVIDNIEDINAIDAKAPLASPAFTGNVGIGTSSLISKLNVLGNVEFRGPQNGTATSVVAFLKGADGTQAGYWGYGNTSSPMEYVNNRNTGHVWYDGASERMRIDSSGNLLVGTNSNLFGSAKGIISGSMSDGGGAVYSFYNTNASGDNSPAINCYKASTTTNSNARFIQFYANSDSQPMGGIVGNGATNVQFASLSDAREKTNIEPISGSLDKVLALNPVSFDWLIDGSHIKAGFVAQDVQQVFPEFVVENVANEGEEERLGLTGGMTGGIIAHLVKAIQELKAEVDDLKAQLEAK